MLESTPRWPRAFLSQEKRVYWCSEQRKVREETPCGELRGLGVWWRELRRELDRRDWIRKREVSRHGPFRPIIMYNNEYVLKQ